MIEPAHFELAFFMSKVNVLNSFLVYTVYCYTC